MAEINRDLLKCMRREIDDALHTIAKEHGLTFNGLGTMRFDSERFGCRVEMFKSGTPYDAANLPPRTPQGPQLMGNGGFPFPVGGTFQLGSRPMIYTVTSITSRGAVTATSSNGTVYRIPPRTWGSCRMA